MATTLTAIAVQKYRAGKHRREIPDGGCPGLYLVIQPTGAKSWALRYRKPTGYPAKLTLGSCDLTDRPPEKQPELDGHLTLAEARLLAGAEKNELARGTDPGAAKIAGKTRRRSDALDKSSKTFSAGAKMFIDKHTVPRKGWRPRDWRETARILGLDYSANEESPDTIRHGLCERWHDRPLAEVTRADIEAIIAESIRDGIPGLGKRNDGESNARGLKMARALSAMFDWLRDPRRRMVESNPCIDIWRPPAPPARDRVLNARADVRRGDELRWFWSASGKVGEPYLSVLRLLALTGSRLDEIAKMRWKELSDDLSTLRLPRERTKNGLPHDVPLASMARAILKNVKRIEGCEFVFTITGRGPAQVGSKVKPRLDAAMLATARDELDESAAIAPWRIHDLRRTVATGMAGIGIAPHIIEACLNHISGAKGGVAGTYNREQYAREKRQALEQWAAHVERIVTGAEGKVVHMGSRKRRANPAPAEA
jgi:integrase